MKKHSSRFCIGKAQSFTLVELLVVMAIIAILAAAVAVAAGSIIARAKRAKADAIAQSLQTGVLNYYTEYSIYPVPADATVSGDYKIGDQSGDSATWGKMIFGLSGNINPYTNSTKAPSGAVANTRGIAFITVKKSDVNADGAPINPLPSSTNLFFNIALDTDYDGLIGGGSSTVTLPNLSAGSTGPGGSTTQGVAIWANCTGNNTSNSAFWVKTY